MAETVAAADLAGNEAAGDDGAPAAEAMTAPVLRKDAMAARLKELEEEMRAAKSAAILTEAGGEPADPLYADLLAAAPADKKDAMVERLRGRLSVLDACAAVDLTEPEKTEIKGKRRRAATRKAKAAEEKTPPSTATAEEKENAVEKLLAQQRDEFAALQKKLDDEKAAFEADLAELRLDATREAAAADASTKRRIAALRTESAGLRARFGGA